MNEPSAAASDGFAESSLGERIATDALRFTRSLAVPLERAWHAVTSANDLAVWLGRPISVDFVAGGRLRIAFSDEDHVDGLILQAEPPNRIAIIWRETCRGVSLPYGSLHGDRSLVTFDLSPALGAGTQLVFTHRFIVGGKPMIDFATGWHVALEALQTWLDDTRDVDRETLFARVEPMYEQYLSTKM